MLSGKSFIGERIKSVVGFALLPISGSFDMLVNQMICRIYRRRGIKRIFAYPEDR